MAWQTCVGLMLTAAALTSAAQQTDYKDAWTSGIVAQLRAPSTRELQADEYKHNMHDPIKLYANKVSSLFPDGTMLLPRMPACACCTKFIGSSCFSISPGAAKL